MKVIKVFNNNAVAVRMDDNTEAIVTGSGIGFKKKNGDEINVGRIQKVYVIEQSKRHKLYRLMEETSYDYFEIAEEIIDKYREELYPNINDLAIFALVDHISFAVERIKKNIDLPNLILKETRWLYPREYEIAQWALDLIYKKTKVKLKDDEAGYIVLHVLDASGVVDKNEEVDIIKSTKDVVNIIRKDLNVNIDENDFEYHRLLIHIRCLLNRINRKEETADDNFQDLYEEAKKSNQKYAKCVNKINSYIFTKYHKKLSKNEMLYLFIHINRIITKQ